MRHSDRVTELLQRRGVVRLRDLTALGVPPSAITRMVIDGSVVRVTRGMYELADRSISADHSLAEIAVCVPRSTICLVSALTYHGITLANPGRVWFAIGAKDRTPKVTHVGTRVVRFGAAALVLGVEQVDIDGVTVRITSPARTIVDCFRYRRIVGLDVALEALRMGVRAGKARPADIAQIATQLRIWSVLRPYLEAVSADDM